MRNEYSMTSIVSQTCLPQTIPSFTLRNGRESPNGFVSRRSIDWLLKQKIESDQVHTRVYASMYLNISLDRYPSHVIQRSRVSRQTLHDLHTEPLGMPVWPFFLPNVALAVAVTGPAQDNAFLGIVPVSEGLGQVVTGRRGVGYLLWNPSAEAYPPILPRGEKRLPARNFMHGTRTNSAF
jgi:hypothetical protein